MHMGTAACAARRVVWYAHSVHCPYTCCGPRASARASESGYCDSAPLGARSTAVVSCRGGTEYSIFSASASEAERGCRWKQVRARIGARNR